VDPPALDRSLFPVTERWTYLNHAHTGVLPATAVDAMAEAAGRQAALGSQSCPDHEAAVEDVRVRAAALMGVPATDVAFVKNTTEGLGFVAGGLEWFPGDRVVVPDGEFPSTAHPWLALRDRGVVVERVAPPDLSAAVATGPPPKLVATSWVQYGTGWRADLAALGRSCRDVGALLCVDAIQGLGVLPAELDAWGVDFATADGHKWLLGPEGAGLLYVRGEHLDRLRVLEPGWNSVSDRTAYDDQGIAWDPTARRFEGGTLNIVGILGLGASIDLLARTGVDRIWAHVDALCDRLARGLTAAGAAVLSDRSPAVRSPIVSVAVDGHDPADLTRVLRAAGIVCSGRAGGIRLSPHGYNTADEVDAVVAALAGLPVATG
jgi:cysteine desulfurase / selenocysteine lyase